MAAPRFSLIAENIRSLHNVGALFRTADALGVDSMYLCGYTAAPPRSAIQKVSLGAESSVAWEHRRDTVALIRELRRQGVTVAALEQTGQSVDIETWQPTWPVALVVGNEVDGVSPPALAACTPHLSIRMDGQKESLNVSVAAGIALAALRRHRA
ncbi:MAG: TrmH family RNA methyltransferase [Candidatus Kerfeldbacteria bacterium]|nr:TrmH family RNA methyltransferase [Candidatus Kerfeldbacteria bacterium]